MISQYKILRFLNFLLCTFGIMISVYAYYVEKLKEKDKDYKALCDFGEFMSCSKVFTSKYGRGFGLLEYIVGRDHWINQPNTVFGLALYTMLITVGERHSTQGATIQLFITIMANMGSVYLGFILYFVLQDLCIVCVTTYIINGALLVVAWARRRHLGHLFAEWKQKQEVKEN